MAAGLGFKDFQTGEVLTAADVDGYLMQGVWVFASAAARDAAVTSPQEGNFAYLKDTNVTTYYTGSAWANLDTTGMTNPMTTTGDTIYSSSGSTPARLGIGTTGQVLTVAGGVPSWATAASGGGMTLLSTTTLSGSSTTISSISGSYTDLMIIIYGYNPSTSGQLFIKPNGSSSLCDHAGSFVRNAASQLWGNFASNVYIAGPENFVTGNTSNGAVVYIYQYASAINNKIFTGFSRQRGTVSSNDQVITSSGSINTASAISSLEFNPNAGTMSAGTVLVYGVK